MPAKSQTQSNLILDAVLRGVAYTSPSAVYLALYTVTPTPTTSGTEVVTTGGTLYNRVAITFGPAGSGSISNSVAVTFPTAGASWGTVVAAAVVDDPTPGMGNILYFGSLTVPKAVGASDAINFNIGAIVVVES